MSEEMNVGSDPQQNAMALEELLSEIERASGDVVRDAGTRFETLIKDWFVNEPLYKDHFSQVQTWKEWSNQHQDLTFSAKDIGIDLVGTLADGSGYAAIQCKFYKANAHVPKAGVDSFLAASNREYFKERFIVATNESWTGNAQAELAMANPPVTLIRRSDLAASMVDWRAYNKGKVTTIARRTPRDYQRNAIAAVIKGFETADRGKLIMACGTGKTYTSLKLAEQMAGQGKLVMFLVPSLSLLSQTLRDWKQQCIYPMHAFAVCSDASTGKSDAEDIDSLTNRSELSYPATTDAKSLAKQVTKALAKQDGMTVIFSTYHSMEVVSDAQSEYQMPAINLVICDEAHRTSGGYFKTEEEKPFTRIHDASFIQADKRLYMTATPKVYGENVKDQKRSGDIELFSMDDETVYGKTFHEITFTQAVQQYNCLVDYKVIVLTVNEDLVKDKFSYADVEDGGITISNAAKVIGCWRALSKLDLQKEVSLGDDLNAMKRAVGFAQVIRPSEKYDRTSSMAFAEHFGKVVESYKQDELKKGRTLKNFDEAAFLKESRLKCETKHIDGSMNAMEKDELLNWLREEPAENICKILFNVRCLSEGVDVPALDAVLFLSPRKSMVDVVQTVGRVMRKAPGKTRGYVIIPIVTPSGVTPDLVLDNNKDFDTVWQVLRALKSIDSNFGTLVDGQLNKIDDSKMEVICLSKTEIQRRADQKAKKEGQMKKKTGLQNQKREQEKQQAEQLRQSQAAFDFGRNEILEDEIKARIVKRVGNRREWEDWAEDVGEICQEQIKHIHKVLESSESSKAAFDGFKTELKDTLNGELSDDEVVEMLGQHVVTKPILDAFFGQYPFSEKNPIAKAMTEMLEKLDQEGMRKATKLLKGFYEAVQHRMKTVKTSAERQTVIKELFEKFFKHAFPKQQEKLGIVYTPIEIVDFINQSVADLMKKEFNTDIAEKGVHILDPFTGTGTFMARLIESGLIPKDRLKEKFENDLHANEIMPLAYYVASMNLESIYYDHCPVDNPEQYEPNKVLIWTDTFADHAKTDLFKTSLAENNKRLQQVLESDIRVIIGNPPYSVGQESQNDDNQNEHYEALDKRLAETYVVKTESSNKNKLYDSYIRAYRWASDRIGNRGIIGFVTNAGWISSNSADGMRKCFAEEFNSIYVYHLKGNQRTSGEQSRKEGGKVFGEGSRSPVAIVLLVKNPEDKTKGKIFFHAVDDYLSREEKLKEVATNKSIIGMSFDTIIPDGHGDWLNQRDDSFHQFMRMDGKKTTEQSIFANFSLGLNSGRDMWAMNSSGKSLKTNIEKLIYYYNKQVDEFDAKGDFFEFDRDKTKTRWSRSLENHLKKKIKLSLKEDRIYQSQYRPFFKQCTYFEKYTNEMTYQLPKLFPANEIKNLVICINQGAKEAGQIALMTDLIANLHFNGDSQCFPRYLYEGDINQPSKTQDDLFDNKSETGNHSGYSRKDGITEAGMKHFREAYPDHEISVDDVFYYIYGILHSAEYRKRYANNLMKELPRIPRVATYEQFKAFSDAGRQLSDLHVNYESQPEYKGVTITAESGCSYRVTQMKYGKIAGKKGNAAKDKTMIVYNDDITISNIPLEVQEYVVNKKSALDWVVERACVSVDKDSGIVNDFNDYGMEMVPPQPRYPLSLLLKVITVSLETMKIVKSLPPLEIHPMDKAEQS